ESLMGFERILGKGCAQASIARIGLGIDLTGLNRFSEADAALLDAESALAAGSSPQGRHNQAIRALVDLYLRWDQAEPGKGYDAKAKSWQAQIPTTQPSSTSP